MNELSEKKNLLRKITKESAQFLGFKLRISPKGQLVRKPTGQSEIQQIQIVQKSLQPRLDCTRQIKTYQQIRQERILPRNRKTKGTSSAILERTTNHYTKIECCKFRFEYF
jgi:hypothetical protein